MNPDGKEIFKQDANLKVNSESTAHFDNVSNLVLNLQNIPLETTGPHAFIIFINGKQFGKVRIDVIDTTKNNMG